MTDYLDEIQARVDAATEEERREGERMAAARAEYERRSWFQPQRWDWLEDHTKRGEFTSHALADVHRLVAALRAVEAVFARWEGFDVVDEARAAIRDALDAEA